MQESVIRPLISSLMNFSRMSEWKGHEVYPLTYNLYELEDVSYTYICIYLNFPLSSMIALLMFSIINLIYITFLIN